jgi:hypothetical protein
METEIRKRSVQMLRHTLGPKRLRQHPRHLCITNSFRADDGRNIKRRDLVMWVIRQEQLYEQLARRLS